MSNRYCIRSIRGAIAALLLALGGTGVSHLTAQTGTVAGVVTAAANGQPILEAAVQLAGTNLNSVTDSRGRYRLDGVPAGAYTVEVRMLGFATRTAEVTVAGGSTAVADFALETSAVTLDEIAYKTLARPHAWKTGVLLPAIDVDQLLEATAPPGSLGRILEGRIPGVRSIGTSGGVGAGRELRIRGTDSFGYTRQRPLVLVDGVRVDTNKDEWGAMDEVTCCFFSGGAGEDRLSDFDPEEIDRVEVLRGPAAAALYGAEGSAGVIRVFTKRGRYNTAPTFTLQTGVGFNRLRANLPTRLRPGFTGPGGLAALDPNEHLIEDGLINKYSLAVRGGGEDATYFVAGGYAFEEGSVKPNEQSRANLRVNLDWSYRDRLHVGVASGAVRNRIWSPQSGSTWHGVYTNALLSDPRRATEEKPYGGGVAGRSRSATVADAKAIRTISDTDRWTGRVQVDYTPSQVFTHRLIIGADRVSEEKTRGLPQGRFYLAVGERGEKNRGYRESRKYNVGFQSTYDYDGLFGASSVSGSLSVGAEAYWDDLSLSMATGRGFPEGSPLTIANAAEIFSDDTTFEASGRGAFLLNRLDLGDNLSVTTAVRVDEHSHFGDNVGAQAYPKAAVAYSVPGSILPAPVSSLRFRGAYGVAGKPPPRDRERRIYDFSSGDFVTVPASRDREPENKHEFETGLDIGLLNNRIGVALTYYDARVRNALFPQEVAEPVVHGRAENSIEIMNRGLEAAVHAGLVDSPAFRWDMSLAYEWNRNRITDLGPDALNDSLPIYRQGEDGTWEHIGWRPTRSWNFHHTGESLDNIVGWGVAGYDSVSNRYAWTDRWFIKGPARPTHMGSLFNTFQIGGRLRLSFQLRGEMGAVMRNLDRSSGVRVRVYDEYLKHLDDEGNPTHKADSVYDYHRLYGAVDKRDHIRLQEVSLSYTVPQGMAGRLGLQRTTVTLSGYNLHWWDDCNCQDPSARDSAADTGLGSQQTFLALPQPRRFLLSVRTRF